jgi:hypothetical protein
LQRFAALISGLASGLALAVRPAGSAETPRARVGPEDAFCGAGFAERLERIFGCPFGWRGRPGQCAAFRPGELTFRPATGAPGAIPDGLTSSRRAAPGTLRRGPVVAGGGDAVRGSRRGRRARVRRTRRSCRPATARPPATSSASRRLIPAALQSPGCSRLQLTLLLSTFVYYSKRGKIPATASHNELSHPPISQV